MPALQLSLQLQIFSIQMDVNPCTPVNTIMLLLEIKPCGLGSCIRDMEAEWRLKVITDLISWIFGKENWRCGMNQMLSSSVRRDMMFLASNSLNNLRGQKWSCPCYHARHLQQIHWSKLLCGMYGLMAKSSVPRLNVCQILMRYRGSLIFFKNRTKLKIPSKIKPLKKSHIWLESRFYLIAHHN